MSLPHYITYSSVPVAPRLGQFSDLIAASTTTIGIMGNSEIGEFLREWEVATRKGHYLKRGRIAEILSIRKENLKWGSLGIWNRNE